MILSRLTPAETLIVWKGNQTTMKDMLKHTLMDLLIKQILSIEEIERQPSKRDPIRIYKYIGTGKNFSGYRCLPHELCFLSAYYKNSTIRILFRNFVKIGYENAHSELDFYKTLRTSNELKDMFTVSLFQRIFTGGFNYTSIGSQLRIAIEDEIQNLETILLNQLNNDKEKALDILKKIGGNVFLLKGIEFDLIKEIDQAFLKELTQSKPSSGCSTGCFTTFDTFESDFDNSCSSDTGGSGCSGDGGCSSGCAGCGGD